MLHRNKIISGIFLAFLLLFASVLPVSAANRQIQIEVDGVQVSSDVAPEIIKNRTMVPLRVISENLRAKVNWSNSEVIQISKGDIKVSLNLKSGTAVKNDEAVSLDSKTYIKNDRTMVPLRFLAETLGCSVNYKDFTVTVNTEPLVIEGTKVKALQYEYHMTMGGVIQQIKGNAYNEAIYEVFLENRGSTVESPANYGWRVDIDTPGYYYKIGQYDFLDQDGNSIKCFDIYGLVKSLPAEMLAGYHDYLIHDATIDQWHLFNDTAIQSINRLVETAEKNGFVTIISNTVV